MRGLTIGYTCAPWLALLLGNGANRMTILKYREFYIVTRRNGVVDLVNPHTEKARAVKSVFAAKWRVGRAQNLATKVRGLV